MRHSLLPAVLAVAALASTACEKSLETRLAEKKAEAWLARGGWTTDYDAARARARQEKKLLFAYFTRSYAT